MSASSTLVESVAGQWSILRAGSREAGGLEIPSIRIPVSTTTGPIRLAIGQGGEPRLLLPLAANEAPVGIEAGNSLAVAVSTFMQGKTAKRFLDLTCLATELEPVFEEVVDEIVSRISEGKGPIDAARSTLADFRSLLAAKSPDQIERTRVAGLVAELVVLNRLLDLSPHAWQAWKGPMGDRHDFRMADVSLEIKASLHVGGTVVTINGIDQLDPPSGGSLHLAHLTLETVASGPLTVARLGGRALRLTDEPSALRDLFVNIGCQDVDSSSWNQYAFRIYSEVLYKVEGAFPRIVPSMLPGGTAPAGVREVRYLIDLSVASSFKCSPDDFDTLVRLLSQ